MVIQAQQNIIQTTQQQNQDFPSHGKIYMKKGKFHRVLKTTRLQLRKCWILQVGQCNILFKTIELALKKEWNLMKLKLRALGNITMSIFTHSPIFSQNLGQNNTTQPRWDPESISWNLLLECMMATKRQKNQYFMCEFFCIL